MAPICAAFYIVFTVAMGATDVKTVTARRCGQDHVDAAISEAIKGSPNLTRVRVYPDEPKMQKGGSSVFPPLLDWWIR